MRAAAALALALMAGSAAAGGFDALAGRWQGEGRVRPARGAAEEAARCRIEVAHDAAADRLEIDGMCAVPGRRIALKGALEGDGPRVTGLWRNPDGPGAATVEGVRDAAGLTVSYDAAPPRTVEGAAEKGGPAPAAQAPDLHTMAWRADADGLRLRVVTADGVALADIRFRR